MRKVKLVLLVAAMAAGTLVGSEAPVGAVTQQFTWFDQALVHDKDRYAELTSPAQVSNWTSPVNWAGGRVYMRMQITAKPSTKAVDAQVCVWRNSFAEETCSPKHRYTSTGVQWVDLGVPNNWWKKNGTWSWASPFSPVRIMMKDAATQKLLMSSRCGASCYTGTDLANHVPISLTASAIVVAPGATLAPPSSWAGCPTAWSPACPGGGGTTNTAPVVSAGPDRTASGAPATVALAGTVSDDGLPNPPGATTASWSMASGPAAVSFSAPSSPSTNVTLPEVGTYVLRLAASDGALSASDTVSVTVGTSSPPPGSGPVALVAGSSGPPSGDVPLRNRLTAAGHTVTVVDDDALTQAAVQNAKLVVIASSVVPSKIPTWLGNLATPVLSSEVYAYGALRLGSSPSEHASQTRVDIVTPSSPLAAGLSGSVNAVTSAATFGLGVPPAGATVVARSPAASSKAAVFAVDTGGALTSGTAPARRVGFFLAYDAPPKLSAQGGSLFDAAVAWALGGTAPPPPAPSGRPWADARSYRVALTVPAGGHARGQTAVDLPLDLGAARASAGGSGTADPNLLRLVEVDGTGAAIDLNVPFQFDRSAPGATSGTLTLLLTGTTAAGGERRYDAYFDVVGSTVTPVVVTPLVSLASVVDAGQDSYRVTTPNGTWYYHRQGGGFSSLVDPAGNDWLNYSTAARSAGEFRGMPNAVYPAGHFHPGATSSTTTVVNQGPLKVTLRSVTSDGWQAVWDLFPDRSRMTMVTAPANYWFLYEGTPGGQIDLTSDVVIRPGGSVTPLSQSVSGDLANPEWTAFADTNRNRSILLAHHQGDAAADNYYLMEGNMTVFGFGRSGTNRYLTGTRQFSVALSATAATSAVTAAGQGLAAPLATTVGAAEVKPAP